MVGRSIKGFYHGETKQYHTPISGYYCIGGYFCGFRKSIKTGYLRLLFATPINQTLHKL